MGKGPTTKYHRRLMDGYVAGTLTCLTAETIRARASARFPIVLNVEPTNYCNLNCYCCAGQQNARRNKGFMPFGTFRDIIDECCNHPRLLMLNLHKDGESFLHPKIINMIGYAREKDCAETIHINTNGTLFDHFTPKKIVSSGIDDITISIDAFRPETYAAIKRADRLEAVVKNTLDLLDARKGRRPRIRVKIMEFSKTRNEIEDFVSYWKDKADDVQVTGVHDWSGAIRDFEITDEQKEARYPCVLLWYALAVNWDGQVSVCNLDWDLSGTVGNFHIEGIADIWQGRKLKEHRRFSLEGRHSKPKICDKCVVWAGAEDMTGWLKDRKEFL